MYEEKANGVKVRTKCVCYEFGKKSSKFFLNLEKQLNQVAKSSLNSSLQWKRKTDKHKIDQELECFYKNPFTEKSEF